MVSSIGIMMQSVTVLQEMLTKATFNQTNFWFIIFSFLWSKILALIFNMFLYTKVDNSKFVEMYRTIQIFIDPHPSPIGILYSSTPNWLKLRSIYRTVYMQTDVNVNTAEIKKYILNYSSFIPLLQSDLMSNK
jgi:hypothetical protein